MEDINEKMYRLERESEVKEEMDENILGMDEEIEIKKEDTYEEEIEEMNEFEGFIEQNSENMMGMARTGMAEHQLSRDNIEMNEKMYKLDEEIEVKQETGVNSREMDGEIEIKDENIKEEIEEVNDFEGFSEQSLENVKRMVKTCLAGLKFSIDNFGNSDDTSSSSIVRLHGTCGQKRKLSSSAENSDNCFSFPVVKPYGTCRLPCSSFDKHKSSPTKHQSSFSDRDERSKQIYASANIRYRHGLSTLLPIISRLQNKCTHFSMFANGGTKKKRVRKAITLDVKLEVLRKFDAGKKVSAIAKSMGLASSTVATIRQNKEKIRSSSFSGTPSTAMYVCRSRSHIMEKMETLLSIWIEDQNQKNIPITSVIIQDKAKSLYDDLKNELGNITQQETFIASNGWFDRFKRRHGLRNICMIGEIASTDKEAAQQYPEYLKKIIKEGDYTPQQVFNVDETVLFWKRMPAKTFITQEEKTAPGFKAARDHLTLLLGGNAEGDFKLKPLLVFHSENPRAIKGYVKSALPVIWRFNQNAWVTQSIFQEWFIGFFCPAVERYCASKNLANKILLILDNAPGHSEHISEMNPNVRVEYLPKHTTCLLQPMDQGVVAHFKAYYLRRTFNQLLEDTDGESKPLVREWWKKFSIMNAVDNIAMSWEEVKPMTMNSVWSKVWPECVHDLSGLGQVETLSQIHQTIVNLANSVGFEDIEEQDVVELLESHSEDLTNEELMQLEEEKYQMEKIDTSPPTRHFTTKGLTEVFNHLEKAMALINDMDPNCERALVFFRRLADLSSRYKEIYREKRRHDTQLNPVETVPELDNSRDDM